MPTPAEAAFAEGFAALASVHAKTWTFGGYSFRGVASALKPDDPRMIGSGDRLVEIEVLTADIEGIEIKRGDEWMCGGTAYRIARQPDDDEATGYTSIIAAPHRAPVRRRFATIGGTPMTLISGEPLYMIT